MYKTTNDRLYFLLSIRALTLRLRDHLLLIPPQVLPQILTPRQVLPMMMTIRKGRKREFYQTRRRGKSPLKLAVVSMTRQPNQNGLEVVLQMT